MAKLFPIGIEVEEVAVGRVLRILNSTAGVAKLHLNLMNESSASPEVETQEIAQVMPPVRSAKQGSSQMTVAQALAIAPSHSRLLGEVLVRAGFSSASLPALLARMKANGFIKRIGVSTWALTPKGQKHYSNPSNHKLTHRELPRPRHAKHHDGVRGLVLTSLGNGAQLLARDLRKILEDNDYSPKNMTGTVGKMRQEGVVQSKDGVYSLTERGKALLGPSAQSTENNQ